MSILAISPKLANLRIFVVASFDAQIHFYSLTKALTACHFCVFEDCILPFCPKVEDLSRHPSIFKPHDDFGAKPKGFGKNVKMCVFVCLLVGVHLCTAHVPVLNCTRNQSLLCIPYSKVQ